MRQYNSQFSTTILSTERVRWQESKCLAAKRSLQGRAAKLLLCVVGYFFSNQAIMKVGAVFMGCTQRSQTDAYCKGITFMSRYNLFMQLRLFV
ncbi:MAG: hypothetical protein CVU05_07265, partial [Bacteroidetes bacterium HGW-Bacteroidetes-21]